MSLFELEDITVRLGDKTIIREVSFSLEKGKVLALLGHNGAGKSTLMRTIMGILEKESGEISINGINQATDFLEFKKQLSYLPEEPMLLAELTVMQHFQLYGKSYEIDEAVFKERVDKYVEGFELTTKLDEYPGSLSKGMRQKVQTICSFLPDIPVLLIDEPFMGLDVYAVEYLLGMMREKLANGTSILLTTHQLDYVKDLANHFLVLKNGEVVNRGTAVEFDTITRSTMDD